MPVRLGQLVTSERSSSARVVSGAGEILFRFAIAAVVSVTVAAAAQFGLRHVASWQDATPTTALLPADDAAAVTQTAARPVYPYSIVAGGVQSSTDVARAMADDVTVAAHYAGLDPSRLRVEHISGPQRAYASYRLGERVYWTSHPVALHGGEAILTDGVTTLRARCGNMLSDEPQQPVSPDEPDEAAFEQVDELPDTPTIDSVSSTSVTPPVAAGASDPGSLHGPQASYLAPFALGGAVHPVGPQDVLSAVISGPPIDTLPIDGESNRPDRIPEPITAGEIDPASIFLHGSQVPSLMSSDFFDPGDPGDSGDPADPGGSRLRFDDPGVVAHDGEPIAPVPVPEPATVTLVGLGLAASVFRARWRRAEPPPVDHERRSRSGE